MRDAELGELGRLLAAAQASSGRVIVVGVARPSASRPCSPPQARRRTDGAVSAARARCSPLAQHAPWGMARQLFDPLRASPDWDEADSRRRGSGRAVPRARGGVAKRRAMPCTPPCAGWSGWPAASAKARSRRVRRRQRPLGRRSVPALAGAAGAVPGRTADRGALRRCARVSPPRRPDLLAELLASGAGRAVRPQALGPQAGTGTLVRREAAARRAPGSPRACHAVTKRQPVPARCPADPVRRASRKRTGRRGRGRVPGRSGSEQGRARHRAPARPAARPGPDSAGRAVAVLGPQRAATPCRPGWPGSRPPAARPRRGRAADAPGCWGGRAGH